MKGKILNIVFFLFLVYFSAPVLAETQAYTEITEDKCIKIALEKNKDIQNAQDETLKADYRIMEAASSAYPQINGMWDYQKTMKPQVFVISFPDSTGKLVKNRLKMGTDHNMNLGATVTQPLYVGGKVGTALKAAKVYKKLSGESLKTVQQNVVTGVIEAFNGVLLAREIRKITIESLTQAENHLKNVQNLFNVGRATEYDLLRAKVNVSNLKPPVIDAENSVNVSLLRLKEIMGVETEAPITVSGALTEPDTTILLTADKKIAFTKRPDLKASELTVNLQEQAIKIARGDLLPTLTAGSSFAYMGVTDVFKYKASDWSRYWYATLSLSFPIFDGFRNYAKLKQSKVDYLKAKTDYNKQKDSISIEVDESIMNFRKSITQIESQRMNIQEAEKAFQISETLFTNGKATQLEVLDAQLALEIAKNNMANALYQAKINEINLKKSLGLIEIAR